MPEATTFRVTTRHKLAKGEAGITTVSSVQVDAAAALGWILDEFPEDSWTVTHATPEGCEHDAVTLVIDWNKVPESIRAPKIPARR
jgi:hypothetical protein